MDKVLNAQLEKLTDEGLLIFQPVKGYRFSLDAVLLARFATVKSGFKIMDLGTGSGVIPLLLLTREQELQITGIEIQEELAWLARQSIAVNHQEQRIDIWHGDLRQIGSNYNHLYDLVISNPPYFKGNSGKISCGDSKAIARHELLCDLQDIVAAGARLLKPKGYLALIHRPARLGELFALLHRYRLAPTRLKIVYPNRSREATMFMLEATKGAAGPLRLLQPLYVYDEAGHYTEEMQEIFNGRKMQDGVK